MFKKFLKIVVIFLVATGVCAEAAVLNSVEVKNSGPGYKIILNTDAPATNAEATYTVKQTKKIIAQITCSALDFVAKRFERYCGTVIASPAALENFLSLVAQKIQFAAVPSARPIPIHI